MTEFKFSQVASCEIKMRNKLKKLNLNQTPRASTHRLDEQRWSSNYFISQLIVACVTSCLGIFGFKSYLHFKVTRLRRILRPEPETYADSNN